MGNRKIIKNNSGFIRHLREEDEFDFYPDDEDFEEPEENHVYEDQSMILDILLAEKDEMVQYREDIKLYHRTKDGKYVQLAEFWQPSINEVIKEVFRKKKLRYSLFFMESLHLFCTMKPYTIKVLIYFARNMRRNNTLNTQGQRLIADKSGVHLRYVSKGIRQLLEMDVIRRVKNKNSYDYMINPSLTTRATLRSLWTILIAYDKYPCESKSKPTFTNFGKVQKLKYN